MTVRRERAHVPRDARALNKTWSGSRRDLIVTNPRGDRLRITQKTFASAENIKTTPRTTYSVDETTRPASKGCTSQDAGRKVQRLSPPGDYVSTKVKRTRPRHYQKRNKTQKVLQLRRHQQIGFGFSIRGGIEHGTGIFISSINKYADATGQGLQVGDQILKANNRSFAGITHDEAVSFIQSSKTLRLVILSIGIIPGSALAHTEYQWVDCYGKPCSPLLGDYHGFENGVSERKVNVVVGNNSKLGLLIRGGSEYGLGIFVAGIDEDSVADRSGIMVGEQILEVNGINFLSITHTDAAHIIRTSKMMTVLLRDVGKVPVARIVLDQTEWIDGRSVASDPQLSPEGSPKGSIFQPGIGGSQLNHQSSTGLTPYRWVEEKAQQYLSGDDWTTLKYYIREYVHGHISVNGLVLSLFDLLETKEKLSILPEIRGIVRAHDIDTYDEMVLRKEVEVIKVNESNRTKKPYSARTLPHDKVINSSKQSVDSPQSSSVDAVEEDEVEEVVEIPSQVHLNPSRSSENEETFGYNELHDQSTTILENMTEDSILCSTPHFEVRDDEKNMMDETLPNVGSEPIYAVIDHSKRIQDEMSNGHRKPSKEEETSSEQETSDQSEDYRISNVPPSKEPMIKEVIMKQQGDVSREVNVIQEKLIDEFKCQVVSAPKDVDEKNKQNNNKIGKIGKIGGNRGTDNTSSSAPQNELAYAFSFLKSHNAEADADVEDMALATPTVNEINDGSINTVENENSSEKQNDETPGITESDSDGYGSDDGAIEQEIITSAAKPNNLFRDLDSEKNPNVNGNNDASEARKIRNYQPKFLVELNRVFKENRDKADSDDKVEPRKTNLNIHGNFNGPRYESEAPSFDATPSMEHRYANFSVNDILRQNYLPLTRSDLNSSFPSFGDENQQQQPTNFNDSSHDEIKRPVSKLSSLNIQNQYQYESSERNRKRSSDHEEVPKIDETKSFGKPVMSRKTDLASTTWETKKKLSQTNLNTIDDNDEMVANDKHSILNPKLRKTKNSELILGIKANVEDVNSASEDFIKATSIAEYLSSDQNDFIDDTIKLPQIKSKIPIFENNAIVSREHSTNNRTQPDKNETPNSFLLDADFRATDDLENGKKVQHNNHYNFTKLNHNNSFTKLNHNNSFTKLNHNNSSTKLNHNNSFTDFRSKDDDVPRNILDKSDESVDEKILSIRSRIDAFSRNGGIRHLQKEIERVNGSSPTHAITPSLTKDVCVNGIKIPDPPMKKKFIRTKKLKQVKIPIETEEPGFQVDNRIGEKGNYIFVSEIKDPNLKFIHVNDVIVAVDNKPFKNGMKQGLANLMIKNAFKCTDREYVMLTIMVQTPKKT